MKSFTLWLFNLLLNISAFILQAYVFTVFWGWFVLTQFTELPHIKVVPALGIMILVSLLSMRRSSYRDIEDSKMLTASDRRTLTITQTSGVLLMTLFIWFDGWLVHLLM